MSENDFYNFSSLLPGSPDVPIVCVNLVSAQCESKFPEGEAGDSLHIEIARALKSALFDVHGESTVVWQLENFHVSYFPSCCISYSLMAKPGESIFPLLAAEI